METNLTDLDFKIRTQIYRHFGEHGSPPSVQQTASLLNAEEDAVRGSFHKLHARHMLFLEPGTDSVRMANPFSAIPTRYRVTSAQKQWWANCAWDAFGIAAALKIDVQIEASYADLQQTVALQVRDGGVDGKNHMIYFPLPCRQWYDDLIFT